MTATHLSGVSLSVPGQNFITISVVGPECPQRTDFFAVQISGAFATLEEAEKHAKKLQKDDPTYDIFVANMYQWLLIPPHNVPNQHFADEKLEEMFTKYNENQVLATKMFEERKRDMMAKPIHGTYIKPGDENSKYYSKPDEAPISHPAEVIERLRKEKPDAPLEELVIEADAIVADEIREKQKRRLLEAAKEVPAPMEVDATVVADSESVEATVKPTGTDSDDAASSTEA